MNLQLKSGDDACVDYSNTGNWLNIPDEARKNTDVFYVYPSSWNKDENEDFNVCPVTHPGMRRGADTVFSVQASIFFPLANVYAPYYRQADPMAILPLDFDERKRLICTIPYNDVKSAFQYYIERFNNGRPFILSAHSQGSEILRELIFDYMKHHPDVYSRMVAAYLIGYGITETELKENPHAKFAQRANDTGVIISYNTEAPGVKSANPTVPGGSLLINPLSWRRDESLAPAGMNAGSLITGRGKLEFYKSLADAKIDLEKRVLICSSIDAGLYGGPPMLGTFHMLDYALYYLNLRKNAALRIKSYFSAAP